MGGVFFMLDYFLEHNVQKKLHIFSILHINHSISVKELAKEVNISSSTITTLIDELNFDLEGIAEISKDNAIITINIIYHAQVLIVSDKTVLIIFVK